MRSIVLAAMTAVTGVVSGFDCSRGWTESFEDFTPKGEGVSLREKFSLDGKKVKIPAAIATQYTIEDYPRWVAENSSTNHTVLVSVDGNAYVGTNYMTIVDKDTSGQVNARLRFKPADSSETGFKFVAPDKEHPNSDFNELNFKFQFRDPANYVSAPVPAAATCDVFDSFEDFTGESGTTVLNFIGDDGKSKWTAADTTYVYKDGAGAYAGTNFVRIVDQVSGQNNGQRHVTKTFSAPGEGDSDGRITVTAEGVPFSYAIRRSLAANQDTAGLTGCDVKVSCTNTDTNVSLTKNANVFGSDGHMTATGHWYFVEGSLKCSSNADGTKERIVYIVKKIYDATAHKIVRNTDWTLWTSDWATVGEPGTTWKISYVNFFSHGGSRGYVDIDAISIGGAGASHAQQGESSTTEDESSGSDSGEESHDHPGSGVSLSFYYSFKTNENVFVTQTMTIPLSQNNFAYDTWYKFKTKVNNVHWNSNESQLRFVDTQVTCADTGEFVIGWKNGPKAYTSQSAYDNDTQMLRANIQLKVGGKDVKYHTDVYLDALRFMSWNAGEVLFDIDDFQFDRKYGVMILLL